MHSALIFEKLFYNKYVCMYNWLHNHSSEIRGFRSMICSSETLQNLPYFCNKKTHAVFFISHNFIFLPYVAIDQGIQKGKSKVAQNKNKKNLVGFLIHKI